jgi:pimeloyl-[acyl-carrier protein] methyl ester esterase
MNGSTVHLNSLSVSAYHGWGFDAACWDSWRQMFVQKGYSFQAFDRGYFHHPSRPVLNKDANICQLTLVHSYGLHLCPIEHLEQTDILVIFASFSEFHPRSLNLRKYSQRILQQMISQFIVEPQLVLNHFKSNCYYPAIWSGATSDRLNFDLLLADLKNLNSTAIDLTLLQAIPTVIVMHGSHDRIVSPNTGKELVQHLPQCSQYIEIEEAGHALPFTHLETCWLMLQDIVKTRCQR